MTDTLVTLSNTAFTALDAGTDLNVQNLSNQSILVEIAGSLPAVTSKNGKIVGPLLGVSRDGQTGNFYGLSTLEAGSTDTQRVSVGA